MWQLRVTTADVGERLDQVLARERPDLTRSQLKRFIVQGLVTVDGRSVKAGWSLRAGEQVALQVPEIVHEIPVGQDIPVAVVYEDASLLVVDKPAGLTVHPGAGRPDGTLVNALIGRGVQLSHIGGPTRPGIVHRLDRGTSGLLVVAKTDVAHKALSAQLERREMSRQYWALVWGGPDEDSGRINHALGRSRSDRRRMRVVTRGGRPAVTQFEVLWRGEDVSALALALETGRTHQIRTHLKYLGHPVFGDPEYGGRGSRGAGLPVVRRERLRHALGVLQRQALHAGALAFVHPEQGHKLFFRSRLPEDMLRAASYLGVPDGALSPGIRENQ